MIQVKIYGIDYKILQPRRMTAPVDKHATYIILPRKITTTTELNHGPKISIGLS